MRSVFYIDITIRRNRLIFRHVLSFDPGKPIKVFLSKRPNMFFHRVQFQAEVVCRDIAKLNNYISDIINNLDLFLFMRRCEKTIKPIVCTVDRPKARLKKVAPLLNNNKQQSQYSQKHDLNSF